MIKILRPILFFVLVCSINFCFAQKPIISYSTPQVYKKGLANTPLTPVNTGGIVPTSAPITLGTGFSNPTAVAIDGVGNVYVAVNGSNSIVMIPIGGGSTVTLGSGFITPTGVAADAAGNVYVADNGNNAVKKIPVGGGAIVNIGSGFISPYGVALDGSGNLFVSDRGSNTIKKVSVNGGTPVIIASGFNSPTGVAVDAAGNVYVTDRGNNLIKEILTGGTVVTIGTGNGNPNGVAVDAAGNVYFADTNNTSIFKILKADGSLVSIGSGFSLPAGVALGAGGIVYIDDNGNGSIKEIPVGGYAINKALPPGLDFNTETGVISGIPTAVSAATNYVVTATNSAGSGTATINISIALPAKPNISYNGPLVYTVATTVTPIAPNNTGDGVPVGGYSITPALPNGLAFDINTGTISGKPVISHISTNYTVTATNAGGSASAILNIVVNPSAKPGISYNTPQVYTTTVAISTLAPTNSGGAVPLQNTVVFSSEFTGVNRIAIDAAGNIYGIDNGQNSIKKIPAGGGSPTVVASGFNAASGIAVDASGNIYVADNGNNAVKKIPAGGGATVVVGSGYSFPSSLATDKMGNVYVSDNTNQIKKISADGGQTITLPFTGITGPSSLAVDASDNVYLTDISDNTLKKVSLNNPNAVILAAGFNHPDGVALDASGNIYVTDLFNNLVKRIPASGGTPILISNGFSSPDGIAVDGSGNIYVADAGTSSIKLINAGGYYISPALPNGLNFDNTTGAITGTPVKPSPATDYTVTAYNSGGSNSVKVNLTVNHYAYPVISYQSPQIYTVKKLITPPLVPSSSGVSPVGDYYSITAASGLTNLRGVAVDAAGNIYVAQINQNTVTKIPADGVSPVTITSGFNGPAGVAVDKFGNVYVADNGNNAVKKIPIDGTAVSTVASGFNSPYGLAIDAQNNMFVTNLGNGLIQKVPLGGGAVVTIGPAFSAPTGVAADASGNIYITDRTTNSIQKISPGSNTAVTVGTAFGNPNGVVVDAAGNLYVVDLNRGGILKIPVGGTPIIVGSSLSTPVDLAIDGNGNLYVSDFNSNSVKELTPSGGFFISPALPPGISFDDNTGAISGTPTAISPATNYKVTAFNGGGYSSANVSIQVISIASLANLTISSGSLSPAFAPTTTTYTAHVPNATASIKLTPTAGDVSITINGTAVESGAASASLPLNVGDNIINTVVTAPDGVTTKTYKLTVTRSAADLSTNALLTSIKLSPNTPIITVTGPAYKNYTTAVPNSETSLNVISVVQDATATINVNGIVAASGAAQPIALKVGTNVITVMVTAQDGATVKNYIITATRASSSIATLANLTTSAGAFNPVFAALTTAYTMHVPNATSSIKLTPTATAGDASITVNGTTVLSGAASASIPLSVGDNTINTVVTASDGTTIKTYTLTVTRSAAGLSTNALLTSLKINPNTPIVTVTGPAYKNYTAAVPNSETSLSVISVVQDATAVIRVNGTLVASGAASQPIPLVVGANVITVAVTAQDGATVKNYIITATRASSSIATLANLTTSAGAFNPVFAALTTAYTMHVPNATASIQLTPTATAGDASITVSGTAVVSGAASASIPLNVGDNIINTVVTASDGVTTKTYKLTVTRSAAGLSTNALLTSLKINPNTPIITVTGPAYKNYTTAVPNSETSLSVTSVVQDATAVIKVNGTTVASGAASPAIPLAVGANVITIAVTAQDGATVKNYIITATRASSSIATLANLVPSSGTLSPVFASATTAYTAHVPNAIASIKLTPTATAGDASIKVNGTAVLSGAASADLPLTVGNNVITTVVAASDGITTKTYTLTVVRSAAGLSTNALLTSIKLSPVTTITTVTGPGYKNYATAVPNSETSLKVIAVVQDATATIKVNGITVASGVASQSIPLSVGANVISIAATAQDGATTKSYIITATRAEQVQSLALSAENPDSLKTTDDIIVHPGVSPNGDGISDYLVIDGLSAYPDNKLTIMDRSGVTVFDAKNYGSKVFDGHSSVTGSMQLPGTYFYLLQYNNGKENKRKTGFILLKY